MRVWSIHVPSAWLQAPVRPRARRTPWIRTLCAVAIAVAWLSAGGRGWAQDAVLPQILPEGNLVAVGVGVYPDYIVSDDYSMGEIPFVR
jgi:hypothetical protein